EVAPGDDDGGGLHAVRGPEGRADGGTGRADEREVRAAAADAGRDARRLEAPGRGDAHTRTPDRRSPAVSAKPNRWLTFWIACPAAPLPRLSIAQTTIVRSVKLSW